MKWAVLAGCFVIVMALDGLTTFVALSVGLAEANFLPGALFRLAGSEQGVALVIVGIKAFAIGLCLTLTRYRPALNGKVRGVLAVCVVVMALVVANNLWQIA